MPLVEPASPEQQGAAGAPSTPAPGFAAALASASSGASTVTLGEMIGIGPPLAVPGVPEAPEAPDGLGGAATLTTSANGDGHPAIEAGSAYLGVPYKWGGTDPNVGFDCSGFVQRAFADIGVDLPRVSADQARVGEPVDSLAEARPGDLVYWSGGGSRPNHIGIYMGDGKMMHAPRSGEDVQVDDVRQAPPTTIRRVA